MTVYVEQMDKSWLGDGNEEMKMKITTTVVEAKLKEVNSPMLKLS